MAKRSLFRDFIKELKKSWRVTFPLIRPLDDSFGSALPKASTFYAGVARSNGMHVFLNFQHSPKAWQVGQFTINVILSQRQASPERWSWPSERDVTALIEGHYRVGPLLGGKDKWWHLKDDERPKVTEAWRPTSYADDDTVIREAVSDASLDVESVLRKLGVATHEDGPGGPPERIP